MTTHTIRFTALAIALAMPFAAVAQTESTPPKTTNQKKGGGGKGKQSTNQSRKPKQTSNTKPAAASTPKPNAAVVTKPAPKPATTANASAPSMRRKQNTGVPVVRGPNGKILCEGYTCVVPKCNPGYYPNNGYCTPCPPKSTNCS